MELLLMISEKILNICQAVNFYVVNAIQWRNSTEEIDAYYLEPKLEYYIIIISTILMTITVWTLIKITDPEIEHIESFINSILLFASIELYLSTLELTSYKSAIFKTANIVPHTLISYIIGCDLQKFLNILIDADLLTSQKMLSLFPKAFKIAVNLFILCNPILINIYLHYILNFEFTRVCILFFGGWDVLIGLSSPTSKTIVNISWSITLLNQFYHAFYLLYFKFESVLPEKEILVLKFVNICLYIISLMYMYNDKQMLESFELFFKLKTMDENTSDSRNYDDRR